MDLEYLIEEPLVWIAFFIFLFGIITRLALFFAGIIKGGKKEPFGREYFFFSFLRILTPYYKAFSKRPHLFIAGYFFHFCIIVVPVWFSGHIDLWEDSRFEWYWDAMSDELADWLTLLFLGIAAFLFIRRLISSKQRRDSSLSDYFVIIVTALPFMTGYFLAHGTLENFISLHTMWTLHVLSGEIMLVLIVFLFCRTRMNGERCTGCAACEFNCPTGALSSTDKGKFRTFMYAHYLCVLCGECASICPEAAAELRHEISVTRFFRMFSRDRIRRVGLAACKGCDADFAPIPQLGRLDIIGEQVNKDYLLFCPRCRKENLAKILCNPSLWNKNRT
jgi:ferredoxin